MIKKTVAAAVPKSGEQLVYIDRVTSQIFIAGKTDDGRFVVWNSSANEDWPVSQEPNWLKDGFCPVADGQISKIVAERTLGHVEEKIIYLKHKLATLKAIQASCLEISSSEA